MANKSGTLMAVLLAFSALGAACTERRGQEPEAPTSATRSEPRSDAVGQAGARGQSDIKDVQTVDDSNPTDDIEGAQATPSTSGTSRESEVPPRSGGD